MVMFWQSKKDLFEKYRDLLPADLEGRSESDPVRVMLLGEFNAGKSSLANAFLGSPVLPVDIFQTTATINRIVRGAESGFAIIDHDGHVVHQDSNLENLANFNADCGNFSNIKWIEIRHPAIPEGIELIDTPGFNDPDPVRDQTFVSMLPSVDIMIFICDANQALKGSELPYIKKYFLNSLSRVRFVFNHSDTLKTFSKLNIVKDLVIKQIRTMLEEAADLFEGHGCRELSKRIRESQPEEFIYFSSAALISNLIDENALAPDYREKLVADFKRLVDYIDGLSATRKVLFEEWRLQRSLETLYSLENEVDFSTKAVVAASHDRDALRQAVSDRLGQQLNAAKACRQAIAELPTKIENDISMESSRFLQKLENALPQVGDDYGSGYLADHYQKEVQGLVQRLNEGIQKRLQEGLKVSRDPLIALDASETSLKTRSLPSQTRRQQEYAQNMATSGMGTMVGAGLGLLLFGLPGAGIGAMIGGQMSQGAGQAAALRAQRAGLDKAYKEIVQEARELLNRVRRDVGQSVRTATAQFETNWVEGTRSAQWQVLELASMATADGDRAIERLKVKKKQISCAIKEFQIASASLRSEL